MTCTARWPIRRRHSPADVPTCIAWRASRRGVFINPALTEPFGLDAAGSGCDRICRSWRRNDGGPRDIIANCDNGLLIDPLDGDEIEKASAASPDGARAVAAMVRSMASRDAQALLLEQITPIDIFVTWMTSLNTHRCPGTGQSLAYAASARV